LSTVEQKLILLLAAQISSTDQDFKPYKFKISDFIKITGNKHNNYSEIEKIVIELKEKNLRIVSLDENNKKTIINTSWLSSSRYTEGSGLIELLFEPTLKSFFLNLKKCFTSFKLGNIIYLKSQFSIRIYELLKQYENIGKRIFKLEELKKILGIKENKYQLYGHFKKRVLIKAQEELELKTDICFDFEEIKLGRKVDKIFFVIKNNTENISIIDVPTMRDIDDNPELDALITLLPEGYKDKISIKKLIKTSLRKHDYDYVARNIAYTNDKSNAVNPGKNMHKKSNYRNYLKKALEKDFGLAYVEDLEEKAKEEKLQREAEELKRKEEARKKEAEEEQEKVDKQIQGYIKALSNNDYKILEQEAINQLKGEKKEAVLNKKAGSNILLKVEIKKVVKERLFK